MASKAIPTLFLKDTCAAMAKSFHVFSHLISWRQDGYFS